MNKIKLNKKWKNGYAILEVLFYIAFFAILSIVVIEAMITMSKSFRQTSLQAELVQSANIIERISREIRGAVDISFLSSSDLILSTTDTAGVSKTVEFTYSGNNVGLIENGISSGNLNSPTITVTALSFTQINTTVGKAIKIVLTVRSNNDLSGHTESFYDTVALRGVY